MCQSLVGSVRNLSLTLATLLLGAAPAIAQGTGIACDRPYIVVPGDTLGEISSRAYGDGAFPAFYSVNLRRVGPNPNIIEVGLVLAVPCDLLGGEASSQAAGDIFPAAPVTGPGATRADIPPGTDVVVEFNRAAAPAFVINSAIIDDYLAQITRVTEGRVRFVDPPATNRDARAQYEIVQNGEVDGAYVFNGYLSESHPLLQLPMQPLMGGTSEQTAGALWRLHERYLSETDYLAGVHLLGFVGSPAAHIWRLREAPISPGENVIAANEYTIPYFDGLDTRGAESVREENAAWLAELDESRGQPLTLALAHGAALAGGIWNENRTVTEIDGGVYTPTFSVILSDETWDRISIQDRARIMEISGAALAARSSAWDDFDNGLRQRMLDQGLEPNEADIELLAEMQDRSRVGVEAWIAAADARGLEGFQAVTDYVADLDELGPDGSS
ncbi:MAG: hypothetical protein AAF264_06615 [Pseudomonadota bacterium]